jgi:hypothetical protein
MAWIAVLYHGHGFMTSPHPLQDSLVGGFWFYLAVTLRAPVQLSNTVQVDMEHGTLVLSGVELCCQNLGTDNGARNLRATIFLFWNPTYMALHAYTTQRRARLRKITA